MFARNRIKLCETLSIEFITEKGESTDVEPYKASKLLIRDINFFCVMNCKDFF